MPRNRSSAATPVRRRAAPAVRRVRVRAARYHRGRGVRQADQIVEQNRGWAEQTDDPLAIISGGFGRQRVVVFLAQLKRPAHDRFDRLDHVGGFRDQGRTLLDQIIGARGAWIERRARHGEHFAPLFGGEPRRDQRARTVRGLDDDDAKRSA
jgi:hypothetical protein